MTCDLNPLGMREESQAQLDRAAVSGGALRDTAGEPDGALAGERPGAIVMGWCLPPRDGEPRRCYGTARWTISTGKPTLWLWDGPAHTSRRRVTVSELLSEWGDRPRWARVLELSHPHPFQVRDSAGSVLPYWSGLDEWSRFDAIKDAWASLAAWTGGLCSLAIVDDEFRLAPHWASGRGYWSAVASSPQFPKWCDAAGVTPDEVTGLLALKPDAAALRPAWHRWVEYAHNRYGQFLRDMYSAILPGVPILSPNHYRKVPSEIKAERSGVWHHAEFGTGCPGLAAYAVKQYGATIDPAEVGEAGDAKRFWADYARRYTHRACSRSPLYAFMQCHDTAPANNDTEWPFRRLGQLTIVHAVLDTGRPLIVSQRMRPDAMNEQPAWAAYVERYQRNLEDALQDVPASLGFSPCIPDQVTAPRPDGRWVAMARSRWVGSNGQIGTAFTDVEERATDPPQPTLDPPTVVRGTLTLDRDYNFADFGFVAVGDEVVIELNGYNITYAAEGFGRGVHAMCQSSDDGASNLLAEKLGLTLGPGVNNRALMIVGPGKIVMRGDDTRNRCHAVGAGGDGLLTMTNIDIETPGGTDCAGVWAPYRSCGLKGMRIVSQTKPVDRPNAIPMIWPGSSSWLNQCVVHGGQGCLWIAGADNVRVTACQFAPQGTFTAAYAISVMSSTNVVISGNVIQTSNGRGILIEKDGSGPACRDIEVNDNWVVVAERTKSDEFGSQACAYALRVRYGVERVSVHGNVLLSLGGVDGFNSACAVGLTMDGSATANGDSQPPLTIVGNDILAFGGEAAYRPCAIEITGGGGIQNSRENPCRLAGRNNAIVTSAIGVAVHGYDGAGWVALDVETCLGTVEWDWGGSWRNYFGVLGGAPIGDDDKHPLIADEFDKLPSLSSASGGVAALYSQPVEYTPATPFHFLRPVVHETVAYGAAYLLSFAR